MIISDDVARDAYIYAYSTDEAYKYLYNTTIAPGLPLNQFQLMRELADDTYTEHPTINNDTLHLMGWLDVGAEPVVVTVPDADEDRYWILQTMDLGHYTDSMFGSRTRGTRGGRFLYAARTWEGDAPEDVDAVVRVESDIVKVMGRIMALDDPADLATAQSLQDKWKLQTLSEYTGVESPAQVKRDYPDPANTNWLERVNFVLCNGSMAQADEHWLSQFPDSGIGPFTEAPTAEQVEAAERGERLGMAHLKKIAPDMKDARKLLGTRAELGDGARDLFAEGTYLGQWGLPPEESMYLQVREGSDGQNLNGTDGKRYRIRMSAPDVSEFWSWTVYRADNRFMDHNSFNRHSRGDRTLTPDADGMYTINLGVSLPEGEDDSTFLPIPEADFYVILRLYGPGPEILKGEYPAPVLEVVS